SARTPVQTHEWRIAETIRLQFESALAILHFYTLREKLVDTGTRAGRLALLSRMETLVHEEIDRRQQLIPWLNEEPALGYHSEAEGFKITVELVRSAISQLRMLLEKEFPEVRKNVGSEER